MSMKDSCEVLGKDFERLPGEITAGSPAEFVEQFKALLDTAPAREYRGIVYLWLSERPIPRVKGSSKILYIGKTDGCMSDRYRRYVDTVASGKNWDRYGYVIKKYGPITFAIKSIVAPQTPKKAEGQLLEEYFKAHLEYPPVNKASS